VSTLKKNLYADTGVVVMTGIAKTTITGGPTLDMALVKDGTLSAWASLVANTATLTLEVLWQGSNDAGAHWYKILDFANPATIVVTTGTAAAVEVYVQAPPAAYGLSAVRLSVINKVADGLIADTYRIGYQFQAAKSA
jgi:hypothetical protein